MSRRKRAKQTDLVTRRPLAHELGCAVRTIAKWEEEGLPVSVRGRGGRANRYSIKACRAWKQQRDAAVQGSGIGLVAAERARKERAQAVLAEQTYAMRARKLIPVEEVERIWSGEITAVRSIILSHYTTAADRVARAFTLEGVAGVENELRELAHEVLRELADPNRDIPPKA